VQNQMYGAYLSVESRNQYGGIVSSQTEDVMKNNSSILPRIKNEKSRNQVINDYADHSMSYNNKYRYVSESPTKESP